MIPGSPDVLRPMPHNPAIMAIAKKIKAHANIPKYHALMMPKCSIGGLAFF